MTARHVLVRVPREPAPAVRAPGGCPARGPLRPPAATWADTGRVTMPFPAPRSRPPGVPKCSCGTSTTSGRTWSRRCPRWPKTNCAAAGCRPDGPRWSCSSTCVTWNCAGSSGVSEGRDVGDPWGDRRGDEWYVTPEETRESLVAALRAQGAHTNAVVTGNDLATLGAPGERWDGATRRRWNGSCSTSCRSTPAISGTWTSWRSWRAARPERDPGTHPPPSAGRSRPDRTAHRLAP